MIKTLSPNLTMGNSLYSAGSALLLQCSQWIGHSRGDSESNGGREIK